MDMKLLIPIGVNSLLGITNRVLQIVYYCLSKYEKFGYKFNDVKEIEKAAFTFCIMPTVVDVFMMGLYCLFHSEEKMTFSIKIMNFLRFILCVEILYPLGVHTSLRTKYSYNADSPVITMRLINAIHFMFVSLPQLLIVPINSSINDEFKIIGIVSMVFSGAFIVWSIGYYFICVIFSEQYEDSITDYVEKNVKED